MTIMTNTDFFFFFLGKVKNDRIFTKKLTKKRRQTAPLSVERVAKM